MRKLVVTTLIALFALPAGIAHAEETDCRGTIGAETHDNIRVPEGASCTLLGTVVQGNIVVETDATLRASEVSVIGNVQAEGARVVGVRHSSVGGSIQVVQGESAAVVRTRIRHDILYDENSGPLTARRNVIGGNLQAFQNTGGVSIVRNMIDGNLQCKANVPPPTGGGNVVQGSKEDQCERL
jgi:hypothetical protein